MDRINQRRRRRPAPMTRRVALAVAFIALGAALGAFSFPLGPARVAPFQHMLNVIMGVMLGPLDGGLVAFAIALVRNAMGTGTVLAFPGSIFGALVVGLVYHYLWRSDHAAWTELIGTTIIGASVGYLMLVGVSQPAQALGFVPVSPLRGFSFDAFGLAFTLPPGLVGLMAAFAVSDIPGVILGFIVLKALRRAGLIAEAE